jgi:phosphate:Na+ symporter
MDAVGGFLEETVKYLGTEGEESLAEVKVLEAKINKLRNRSRKSHANRMQEGDVNIREGLIFLDMMTNMEKIGDYCYNVCSALHDIDTADRR